MGFLRRQWSRLKWLWSRLSRRGLAIIAAIILIVTASLYWVDYFQNQYIIYTIQVVSGNWSSSQPDKFNPYVFVIGALVAVALNLVTVAGVVKAAIELTLIRKNKMNIRNAFNLRDQLALKEIMSKLDPLTKDMTPEEVEKLEEVIWSCFIEADRKWEDNAIPKLMPGSAGREFLETVTRGPN